MAILSNGKFSGFLCSIRDTGKKLKDGAAVMVEDTDGNCGRKVIFGDLK